MKQPTCEELGFCQALAECPLDVCEPLPECHVRCSAPAQKNYPFAPGVIEGMRHGRAEAISRAVLMAACFGALVAVVVMACLAALAAVAGFAAGYLNLQGLLP